MTISRSRRTSRWVASGSPGPGTARSPLPAEVPAPLTGRLLLSKALFQSLERLQKEKADKEELVLEIQVVRCRRVAAYCRASPAGWLGVPRCHLSPSRPRPRPQKADRAALAGKVSCAQFDAAVEQLNKMIEDTLSKVTGQEQGWHHVQQKLVEELGSKVQPGSSPLPSPLLHAEGTPPSWVTPRGFGGPGGPGAVSPGLGVAAR